MAAGAVTSAVRTCRVVAITTMADTTSTASAPSVTADGVPRDPVDVAGAGMAGALTGAEAVVEVGTAPPMRHSVATCGGGLMRCVAGCAGMVNTTGGAVGAPAGGGATAGAAGGMTGTVVTKGAPGTCGCVCGCEPGCFCCELSGWPACEAVGEGAAGVICSGAVAGVPATGSPSRPLWVATIVCDPAAAAGTVKLNATAPLRSGAPDHSLEPDNWSRWSSTAVPAGLNPPPEPSTVDPAAALAVRSAMCAAPGAAITVTPRIAAATTPTAAAASRIHVDRQGYNNAQPRPGAGVSPILWGRSVLMRTGECKSARSRVRPRCTVRCMAGEEWRATAEVMRSPLDHFVAARTQAVRAFRALGQAEVAARINALRKPSVVLWALNQAGAVAADDLDALREEGIALRGAQARVLSGERTASAALQRAMQDQRQRLDVLTRRLGMVLNAGGHGAPDATLRRISNGLRAASIADDATWRALRDGRLLSEPDAATFPVMDVPPAPAARQQLVEREAGENRRRREAAEAEVRRAEALLENAREQELRSRHRRMLAERALDQARARLGEVDAAG